MFYCYFVSVVCSSSGVFDIINFMFLFYTSFHVICVLKYLLTYGDVFSRNGRRIRLTMVWHGMVNVFLYSCIITKVSNALNTLVSGEKPGFQALSKGLIVLLCLMCLFRLQLAGRW